MLSILQYRRLQTKAQQRDDLRNIHSDTVDRPGLHVEKEKTAPEPPGARDKLETLDPSEHGDDLVIFVNWDGDDDPQNPRNWSKKFKVWITAVVWLNAFALDWSAGSNSQLNSKMSDYFHVSEEIESLGPAMYTFGIAAGALFAGPIAETVGRNPIYIFPRIFHLAFVLGCALAPNEAAHDTMRFLAGLGASTILAIHGASIADIWGAEGRGIAWPFVALGSFYGTVLAPIVGGWIANYPSIDWQWAEWIALVISFITFLITFFGLPETFAPILLKWKAAALRKQTGDDRFLSQLDIQETLSKRLKISFHRAWLMTTSEPIVTLLGVWLIIVYVTVFGFLQGFKYIFEDTYEFEKGWVGTSFCSIVLGIALNTALAPMWTRIRHKQAERWNANPDNIGSFPPECRLQQAFVVAPLFPISMFWLGWTNNPDISFWSNEGAMVLFGFSWAGIYVAIYQYIFDVYGIYSGSALASITCLRYSFSGAMTMSAKPLYESIGVPYVMTFIGTMAAVLAPAPFLFYKFGPWIRSKSRFAGASGLNETSIGNMSSDKSKASSDRSDSV